MRKRYLFGSGLVLLAILLTLVVWQVSFSFGEYGPANTSQTFVFWAISTLIFLLTVTLGFMLFRTGVKLYIERQSHREGSRIKSKLVFGALALSLLPVVFMLAFSYVILNRNVEKWFSRPAEGVRTNLVDSAAALDEEVQDRAQALANWLATLPDVAHRVRRFREIVRRQPHRGAAIHRTTTPPICAPPTRPPESCSKPARPWAMDARCSSASTAAIDLESQEKDIERYMSEYNQLAAEKKNIRKLYLLFLVLIALFILFVATWIALLLSRQISVPISALLVAASEVRKGNLGYRVQIKAIDELATLVRAFNEMMHELEANSRELESRRRFTEAILESIPTGVISLDLRRPHPAREPRAARPVPGGTDYPRRPPRRSVSAPRRRRNRVPDEARQPHRRSRQPDRSRIAAAGPASGRHRFRAARAPPRRSRIRAGPRRHQRAAARAEGRGLA